MGLLQLLIKLFGKSYVNRMIGTGTNVSKPIKLDKNSPFKLYSDSAFNDPKVLDFIEEKIMEYGPFALSNKNAQEIANFEMNARRLLNARNKKEGSQLQNVVESMFGPLGKKTKPEADIVDITTKQKVDDTGIMKLKKELGLPEGVEPGSMADKAIKESVQYKMNQQGVKKVLDKNYVPPKTTSLEEDFEGTQKTLKEQMDRLNEDDAKEVSRLVKAAEDDLASIGTKKTKMSEQGAKAYSANIESYRRPIIRQMLLKDTRINLPEDVRSSLLMRKDLQRGADPNMDPLRLLNEYYDVDFKKLDELEDIRFTAGNEFQAADEFLKKGGLKPKKPLVRESLDDEAVELEETKNLDNFDEDVTERAGEIIDDDDIPDMAEGGRIGFAGGGIKALLALMNKKFGKDVVKTADKADRPESALNRDMFGAFEDRLNRQVLDVPEAPPGFKLSKERLLKNFPEIDEDFADEIMSMDRDLQLRIIKMIEDRRKDPEAYDKLLMEKGNTLDFQGEFDRSIQRGKNADGGLNYLMGM